MRCVTTATSHFASGTSDPSVQSLLSIPLLSCSHGLVQLVAKGNTERDEFTAVVSH